MTWPQQLLGLGIMAGLALLFVRLPRTTALAFAAMLALVGCRDIQNGHIDGAVTAFGHCLLITATVVVATVTMRRPPRREA